MSKLKNIELVSDLIVGCIYNCLNSNIDIDELTSSIEKISPEMISYVLSDDKNLDHLLHYIKDDIRLILKSFLDKLNE